MKKLIIICASLAFSGTTTPVIQKLTTAIILQTKKLKEERKEATTEEAKIGIDKELKRLEPYLRYVSQEAKAILTGDEKSV